MTTETARVERVGWAHWKLWFAETEQPVFLYVFFAALLVIFSVSSPFFLTASNLLNIANQTALVTIMAMGAALVIITAEIDLSVGSTLALSGVCAAMFMRDVANSWMLAALTALVVGATVGLLNGVLAVRLRIPSFLVTLGTLSIARGLALLITGTSPVLVANKPFWALFGEGHLLGVVDMLVNGAIELAIAGDTDSADFGALARAAAEEYAPSLVLAGGHARRIALLEGREPREGRATAYLCRNHACDAPTADADALREQILMLRRGRAGGAAAGA